jgi:integrase
MPVKKASIGRTLAPRAVDGHGRNLLSRKRHQDGQLIRTKHGWSVRYYERGDGQRKRVQLWLGTYEEMTRPQAKTKMQAALTTVNQNPLPQPQQSTGTFRYYAKLWLTECETRTYKDPAKPSVLHNWRLILKNHLYGPIGDLPLSSVGNKTMGEVVTKLKRKLKPATIKNVMMVVKLVRASAIDEETGVPLYPITWVKKIINAPLVDPEKQETPCFTREEVTRIVAAATGKMQMIAILLAATGLRMGELNGLEVKHFNGESIKVEQAVWAGNGSVGTPKTPKSKRTIDLHPDIAALLKSYIVREERKKGFIFQTSSGRPVGQSNLLRREFHPLLVSLKIEPCGFHAFRRYRITHLRKAKCPESILRAWAGHADKNMTDHYDKSVSAKEVLDDEEVQFRRDVAKAMGVGFDVPKTLVEKCLTKEKLPQLGVVSLIGRQTETELVQ